MIENSTPSLPKWPFILVDVTLLIVAGVIANFHPHPFAPVPFITSALCVVLGTAFMVVPFLVQYGREQHTESQALRAKLGVQTNQLIEAAEMLTRTTSQLKGLEEATTRTYHHAEKLPQRLQEKVAELKQLLEIANDEEKETLTQELATLRASETDRLQTLVEKVQQTGTEWGKLDTHLRKHASDATEAGAKASAHFDQALGAVLTQFDDRMKSAITRFDGRLEKLEKLLQTPAASPVLPTPGMAAVEQTFEATKENPLVLEPTKAEPMLERTDDVPTSPSETTQSVPNTSTETTPVPEATEEESPVTDHVEPEQPKRKRSLRKPKSEPEPALETPPVVTQETSVEPSDSAPIERQELPLLPLEDTAVETAGSATVALPEVTASDDGRTKLLVTAYIGIGNKLFVRGEGSGLSWDKGEPLQFVSIGRWSWSTKSEAPVSIRLYKNDEVAAGGEPITLTPGQVHEIRLNF